MAPRAELPGRAVESVAPRPQVPPVGKDDPDAIEQRDAHLEADVPEPARRAEGSGRVIDAACVDEGSRPNRPERAGVDRPLQVAVGEEIAGAERTAPLPPGEGAGVAAQREVVVPLEPQAEELVQGR